MKHLKILLTVTACLLLSWSCEDETKKKLMDFPNDVTFNEGEGIDITPEYLNFLVPEAPFKASAFHNGHIILNVRKNVDGTHSGFALSNKNYRSYPWCTAKPRTEEPTAAQIKAAVDSSMYSVYTNFPSQVKTFTVVRVDGDEAYFTIDRPRVVEHILVANTNYNYMLLTYGSRFSSNLNASTQVYDEMKADGSGFATVRNPKLPDASSSKHRVWYFPDPYNFGGGEDYIRLDGQNKLNNVKGYVKLIAKGYNGTKLTGESEYYIALKPDAAPAPYDTWNIIQDTWAKWDLSKLGEIDKIVFHMDSSDKDLNGRMRTPPYFCMDGVRLK